MEIKVKQIIKGEKDVTWDLAELKKLVKKTIKKKKNGYWVVHRIINDDPKRVDLI